MKLNASNAVEALREQVRAASMKDGRFNKSANDKSVPPGCGCWVADLIAPENGGDWGAIIQATDGKLYEVPFTVAANVVKLGEASREVFRSVRYLPLAARHANLGELPVAIHARDLSSEVKNVTDRWMFAPGGIHTITPAAGDGSAEVTLKIDASTVPVLNASLAKLNAEHAPQRAFIDKEHDEAAGATAWPEKFVWSETPAPGIYVEHKASDFGRQLVEGKTIRAFSPSFYSDAALPKKLARGQHIKIAAGKRGSPENPARMIGLVYPAIGTLTNNPAFKKILPLWAKNAPGAKSS
jgi:hypothetical protein